MCIMIGIFLSIMFGMIIFNFIKKFVLGGFGYFGCVCLNFEVVLCIFWSVLCVLKIVKLVLFLFRLRVSEFRFCMVVGGFVC